MTRFSLGYIGGGAVVPPKGMANGALLEEDTIGNIDPALPAFTAGQYALLFASASHTVDAAVPAFTAPAGWTAILNGASSGGSGEGIFRFWKERLAIYGKRLQAGDAAPNVAVGWSGVGGAGGFAFIRRAGFVRTYDNVNLAVPFESAALGQNIEADETVTGITIGGRAILDSGRLAIVALGWSGTGNSVGPASEWDAVPGGPTDNLNVDERIFRVAGTTPTQSKPFTVPIGVTTAVVRAELSLVPA